MQDVTDIFKSPIVPHSWSCVCVHMVVAPFGSAHLSTTTPLGGTLAETMSSRGRGLFCDSSRTFHERDVQSDGGDDSDHNGSDSSESADSEAMEIAPGRHHAEAARVLGIARMHHLFDEGVVDFLGGVDFTQEVVDPGCIGQAERPASRVGRPASRFAAAGGRPGCASALARPPCRQGWPRPRARGTRP